MPVFVILCASSLEFVVLASCAMWLAFWVSPCSSIIEFGSIDVIRLRVRCCFGGGLRAETSR
jgi:hypothetical protein